MSAPASGAPAPAGAAEATPHVEIVHQGIAQDAPPVLPEPTPRWKPVLAILLVWLVVWYFTRGHDTLVLPGRDHTPLHESLSAFRDRMIAGRSTNPVMRFTGGIAEGVRAFVEWLQTLVSVPAAPRPVPQVGWLGVTALATLAAGAVANWRMALLTLVSFLSFGIFGFWTDALDLLIVIAVSVLIAVAIGLPLAVLVGTNKRAAVVIETILDLMQTMPTFVYLIPVVLFFGIGTSGAIVCTLVYAIPPLIRIGGHGIRTVSPALIEVTDSLGQTRWQRLLKVQLPLARKTLVVGLSQTTMAALSMATIASFINGPGLGQPVLDALQVSDVGAAFIPGALIVLMAIMLDRVTTAANERSDKVARGLAGNQKVRRVALLVGAAVAAYAVVLSRQYLWAASWDKLWAQVAPSVNLRRSVADAVTSANDAFTAAVGPAAEGLKNLVSSVLLNPLQSLLADSPWWLAFAAFLVIAFVLGGRKALLPVFVCLVGIRLLDLWNDAMVTLAMTLVATVLVMVLAVVVGVAMARSKRVDLIVRPILDAGQTIPAFVFLIPVLALFDATRFTAIVAGTIYAAPVAIKLVADGVKAVPETTMEAVRSQGATTMQQITQAQLPMAKSSLVLAANQGLLYVLAMAVIGGMVGAGALGYDVVLGFARSEEWGKGAAAGLTIVFLGIFLDKITRNAANRQGGRTG